MKIFSSDILTKTLFKNVSVNETPTSVNSMFAASSNTYTIIINYTDINSGISPVVASSLHIGYLPANAIIKNCFAIINIPFVDSNNNNDCQLISVFDVTNRNILLAFSGGAPLEGMLSGTINYSPMTGNIYVYQTLSAKIMLAANFIATDLTLLTAGQLLLSYEIVTI